MATDLKRDYLAYIKIKLLVLYAVSTFFLIFLIFFEGLHHSNKWAAVTIIIILAIFWARIIYVTVLKPLEDILKRQKRFIADAAHELRTPITNTKTSAEVALLAGKNFTAEEIEEVLRESVEEMDRMGEIIKNLTDMSHLENRQVSPIFNQIDLSEIASRACEILRPLAQKKNIKIKIANSKPVIISGNKTAIEEMAINVIKNAISYTPENGNVAISVSKNENGHAEFFVKDSGIGISAKDLPHIFDPFFRVDKSRTREGEMGGSGLGLSIVREIIQQHNGSIKVKSALNQGTTVTIKI